SIQIGTKKPEGDWKFTTRSAWSWSWKQGLDGPGLINMGADFVRLGARPFEGDNLLSELLEPQYASAATKAEVIEGRACHVVDVRRPLAPVYFARIWIDQQRGIPVRIEYYKDPSGGP